MPFGWATVGAAAIGAGASLYSSSQTSAAAKDAASLQLQMYNQTRGDLSPYNTAGQQATTNALALANQGQFGGGTDYLTKAAGMVPGQMTQAQLEATPGYQWDLAQGLKATQSAAAARGLGVSGASLKGASTYATGLANKTYSDQFNIAQKRYEDTLNLNTAQQTNLTNQFNRLSGIATIGENAAAQTGAQGTSAASTAGNYQYKSGQADAAGTTGAANALTGAANSYLAQQNFNTLMNKYGTSSQTGGYGSGVDSPIVNSGTWSGDVRTA